MFPFLMERNKDGKIDWLARVVKRRVRRMSVCIDYDSMGEMLCTDGMEIMGMRGLTTRGTFLLHAHVFDSTCW
jgi:hypothetical protein